MPLRDPPAPDPTAASSPDTTTALSQDTTAPPTLLHVLGAAERRAVDPARKLPQTSREAALETWRRWLEGPGAEEE